MAPTRQLIALARAHACSNVHDYLILASLGALLQRKVPRHESRIYCVPTRQTTQVSRHRSKNTATALQMAVTGVSHILPLTAHCTWHNDASRCRQHSTEASSAGCALCAGSDDERHSALFAGVKGGKAIDEIAARKGRFEWGAFLTAAVEAPPAETGGAAAAADNCSAQVR